MTIEEAIAAELIRQGGVAALVGTRVYPTTLPEKPTYPAIVYERIGATPVRSHSGFGGLTEARYRLTVLAATPAEAARVAVAVEDALDGFSGFLGHDTDGVETDAIFLDDDSTGYEDDLQVYRRDLVFWIQHTGR